VRWLALLALAGCAGLTHRVRRDSPGDVDLDTPYRPEWGDPSAYQEAGDPGEHALAVAPGVGFGFGAGRAPERGLDCETFELDAQLYLGHGERSASGGEDDFGYPWKSWGGTLGWAIAQVQESCTGGTTVRGPIYLEATRQWYLLTASAGLAVYPTPGDVDAGAQLTLSAAIWTMRFRYMQDSGFEAFFGYQLFLPASVTWSR
jgi:hypothetical protein